MPLLDDSQTQQMGPQNPGQVQGGFFDRLLQLSRQQQGQNQGAAPPPMPAAQGQPDAQGMWARQAPGPWAPPAAPRSSMAVLGLAAPTDIAAGQPNPPLPSMPTIPSGRSDSASALAAQYANQTGGNAPPAPAAAPPPGLPGTGISGAAASQLAPGQMSGVSPLPDALVPPGMPIGSTFVNPGNGLTTDPRTWQNTPLASGLPTYNQVAQQLFGPNNPQAQTPAGQQQIMQSYANLLQGQSQARTAAGQLGVSQGDLGLRGIMALAPNGSMANETARTNEIVAAGAHARADSTQSRTIYSNILNALAAQGIRPTAEDSERLMDSIRAGFAPPPAAAGGNPAPAPGGNPMTAQVPGQTGPTNQTPMGAVGGANPPGSPPPAPAQPPAAPPQNQSAQTDDPRTWTGNDDSQLRGRGGWADQATQVDNANKQAGGRMTTDQRIGEFLSRVRPTPQNINALAAFMTKQYTNDGFQNWLTGRDYGPFSSMLGGGRASDDGRRAFISAMQQLNPNSIGMSVSNPQSSLGVQAFRLGGR